MTPAWWGASGESLVSNNRNVSVLALLSFSLCGLGGCGEQSSSSAGSPAANENDAGSVNFALVQGGVTLTNVSYTIVGPNNFTTSGTLNVSSSTSVSGVIGGLPAGSGYAITLSATGTDGATTCGGSASFSVTAHAVTTVSVTLDCHQPPKTGRVFVNGTTNVCPVADGISANPSDVAVGFPAALAIAAHDADSGPTPLAYSWTPASGSFSNPGSAAPTFICNTPGPVTLTATVSDGDATPGCADTLSVVVTCEPGTLLVHNSLVISSSTYDRTHGAVAALAIGTKLAGSATATVSAVAGNSYVNVWSNLSRWTLVSA